MNREDEKSRVIEKIRDRLLSARSESQIGSGGYVKRVPVSQFVPAEALNKQASTPNSFNLLKMFADTRRIVSRYNRRKL